MTLKLYFFLLNTLEKTSSAGNWWDRHCDLAVWFAGAPSFCVISNSPSAILPPIGRFLKDLRLQALFMRIPFPCAKLNGSPVRDWTVID